MTRLSLPPRGPGSADRLSGLPLQHGIDYRLVSLLRVSEVASLAKVSTFAPHTEYASELHRPSEVSADFS
jgi:hypothetical protein